MSKMINKQVMGILVIIVGVILLPILSTSINAATASVNNAQTTALLGILPLVFTVGLVVFGVYSFIQGMRESNGGGRM